MDFVSTNTLYKKTVHNDFWCGYYTLPAIHTFSHPQYGSELKGIASKIQSGIQDREIDLRIDELIYISGGCQYTLSLIDKYAEEAKAALSIFKNSISKEKMIELVATLQASAHRLNPNI